MSAVMRYTHFKSANVDISQMAVGTWAIGGTRYGEVDEKDSIDAIRAMLDGGVNLIDTAPGYGVGHSEEVVGKAIKGLDRSKFFIATKFGISATTMKAQKTGDGSLRDSSFESVLYECEQSLRRLGTDYIDFYLMHWPDYDTPFEETAAALNHLKKQGKIRFVGLSNVTKEQITEFRKYTELNAIQPAFSMVVRKDRPLMEWAHSEGIDTMTYGSLGAGILTGAFRTPPQFAENDYRNSFYPFFKEPEFSQVMKVLAVMDEISAETGRPLAQIAINWSNSKDFVSTCLCGVRNVAEARENCATFDWDLTADQVQRLDEAIAKYLEFDGTAEKYKR